MSCTSSNCRRCSQRQVVEAFLAASRGGDLDALLAVLDPDVVRRADLTAVPAGVATEVRGARAVAEETVTNTQRAQYAQLALVNGAPGIVLGARGRLELALCLTVRGQKIAEIDVIANPARLRQLNLAILDG
jgi:ketosteroid isomerase-like protein